MINCNMWRYITFEQDKIETEFAIQDNSTSRNLVIFPGQAVKIRNCPEKNVVKSCSKLAVYCAAVVDYESNLLFWVDAKLHHIACSDLLGNNQHVVITSYRHLRHPFAITVFEVLTYNNKKYKKGSQSVWPKLGCSSRRPRSTDLYQILWTGSRPGCVS